MYTIFCYDVLFVVLRDLFEYFVTMLLDWIEWEIGTRGLVGAVAGIEVLWVGLIQVFIFVGMSFYNGNSVCITLLNIFGIGILCVLHISHVLADEDGSTSMPIVDRPPLDRGV